MAEKHYGINYLEGTGRILKNLKEYSYRPFINLSGGTLIDLGCGTGQDVIKMAEVLSPDLKIIGIDHDPEMLARANSLKKNGNVEFLLSEADVIPFQDQTISGVRTERLIQHLKEPAKTISEVHRVLKNEHPFVMVETDWPGLIFYNEHVEIEQKINRYLTQEKINNGKASRKLISYLKDAGFRNIAIEVFPFVLKSLHEANEYLWIERMLQEAAEKNYIDAGEYSLFTESLHHADANNYFACAVNMVVVSSIK